MNGPIFGKWQGVVAFLRGDSGKASGLLIRASEEAKTLRPNPALAARLMRQWRAVKFETLKHKVQKTNNDLKNMGGGGEGAIIAPLACDLLGPLVELEGWQSAHFWFCAEGKNQALSLGPIDRSIHQDP